MNKVKQYTDSQIKLIMTVAVLLLAFVLLGVGTYAWFTVSRAPEVSEIKVALAATDNFEIAKFTSDSPDGPPSVTFNDMDEAKKEGFDEYCFWGQTVVYDSETNNTITTKSGQYGGIKLPATIDQATGELVSVTFDRGNGEGTPSMRTAGSVKTKSQYEGFGPGYYITDDEFEYPCAAIYKIWLRTNITGNISATVDMQKLKEDLGDDVLGVSMIIEASEATSGGTYTLEGGTVQCGELKASDKPTLVTLTVYLDGERVNALTVAGTQDNEVVDALSLSIKFTNSSIPETAQN